MGVTDQIADALTREHHAIDAGIETFLADDADPATLREALDALRRHIYLEERFLFPPLKQSMMMPIIVMLREHGELWRGMDAIESALSQPEADAQVQCRELLRLLDDHNRKEEPIIYPRVDADLPDDVRAELMEFIATGSYPAGWVCEQA